ncbi:MAG: MotA/TolQ/ExbB proton channel family protein [candidate division KSB1 bacterium]|nr:MotA/TolQ/ExbB proton channel family protein [candidate division KSB1 bacterium]MDZ7295503.1 MotA/TolQ/ExbB proton channel family protein [candidate division KSB1 bacterium]MDZ7337779.1 MotA/TolQ/ExbB proton channel family protein [candidate division KSB1 bacterium]MDZ7384923.1 MotA/TolQ/ExbB proton channel family protein [candidate division KSB1 bacterium]MDZ7391977.1 MotA/TolQ/ExbB proton channel family protein [candidate division KSB1 bacterium]
MSELISGFSPSSAGYVFMWVLLFIAAVAVAIFIERAYYIKLKSDIDAQKFMGEIRKRVKAGEYKEALALCEAAKDRALARVVSAGLRRVSESETVDFRSIQNAVDEGTLEVIPKLQNRTGYLAMIANVATLVGLMGTVYGLIIAFRSVSGPGIDPAEKARLLAAGIAVAMNTTLFGLIIAVPTIVAYTWLHSKTTKIIDEIDEHMVKLINLITGNQ